MTRTVAIYVFDNVEVLDFAGPYEVFSCASRMHGAPLPFKVRLIGQRAATLRARAGLKVVPDAVFSDAGQPDLLLIPGGVMTAELDKPEVIQWIAATAPGCELVASVCTGSFLLAAAGLLDGQEASTHWADVNDMRQQFPQVQVRDGRRWIDNGRVVTSAGISAGIDMALHLVERLAGRELALRTARQMDYHWSAA